MTKKTVWQCDEEGRLVGIIELSEVGGDWGRDGWLIPAGCVETEPPEAPEEYLLRWAGSTWEIEKIETPCKEKEAESSRVNLRERLNQEYSKEKGELLEAFLTAQIHDDLETQYEIRSELKELEITYGEKSSLIELGKNPWEGEDGA